MKKIFVKPLNYLIDFDKAIKTLKFNSAKNYRDFTFNLYESLIFSIDNEEMKLDSDALVIKNPFEIDLNEKKIITAIYKKLQSNINDSQQIYIQNIEVNAFKLFDELLEDVDYHLQYNEEIDINKLFSNFSISFPEIDYNNYLELLSTYCSLHAIYNKVKIIISFGALNLLTKEEISILEKELDINNLVMLDITYNSIEIDEKNLFIDDEWCIL